VLARDDFGRLTRAFRALDPSRRGFFEPSEMHAVLGAGAVDALTAAELADMVGCGSAGWELCGGQAGRVRWKFNVFVGAWQEECC